MPLKCKMVGGEIEGTHANLQDDWRAMFALILDIQSLMSFEDDDTFASIQARAHIFDLIDSTMEATK